MGVSWCVLLAAALAPAGNAPDLRCGSYCLFVGLKALDFPVSSFEEIERRLGQPATDTGYSLGQIEAVAKQFGARTLGVRTTPERLARRPGRFVALAHVNTNHFVILGDVGGGTAKVIDPPREYSLPLDTLRGRWDGTALLISREPLVAEEKIGSSFPWGWMAAAGAVAAVVAAWLMRPRRNSSAKPTSARR
jgi:ABC-type bacteriocin/lantibiotic exporter with double-glycine peptidase domain